MVEYFLSPERPFKFRPSHLLNLHRLALEGISKYAGNWRPAGIKIGGSRHQPVGAHQVPEMVEDLCEYVNENWARTALHLSAYVMWRLNWIHPFTDGNGRTSRAASYLIPACALDIFFPEKRPSRIRLQTTKHRTTRRLKPRIALGVTVIWTFPKWKSCFQTCSRNSLPQFETMPPPEMPLHCIFKSRITGLARTFRRLPSHPQKYQ